MNANLLYALLDEANLDPQQYSGRGMSHKVCPAFTITSARELLRAGFEIASALNRINSDAASIHEYEAADDVSDLLEDATTDSLGKRMIVYFPRFTWDTTEAVQP